MLTLRGVALALLLAAFCSLEEKTGVFCSKKVMYEQFSQLGTPLTWKRAYWRWWQKYESPPSADDVPVPVWKSSVWPIFPTSPETWPVGSAAWEGKRKLLHRELFCDWILMSKALFKVLGADRRVLWVGNVAVHQDCWILLILGRMSNICLLSCTGKIEWIASQVWYCFGEIQQRGWVRSS